MRSLLLGAISLLAGTLIAHGQEKPLHIGVLALGPRYEPLWTCGQDDYQPTAAVGRTESVPFYVRGLRDGLQKLNYVEGQGGNLGKGGRRFILEVRTGTLQQVREFAGEFVAKRVDAIVAIATAPQVITRRKAPRLRFHAWPGFEGDFQPRPAICWVDILPPASPGA